MSSLKIAAVGVLLTAGLSHAYFPVLDKRISIDGDACGDMSANIVNDQAYCCPGAVKGTGSSAYCCVGAPVVSFQSCFPFCSGSQTSVTTPCSTTIPLTVDNYASSACDARSLTGGDAGASCPTPTPSDDNGAPATTDIVVGVTTTSPDATSAPGATPAGGSTTSPNFAAMITRGPALGMGVVGLVAAVAL